MENRTTPNNVTELKANEIFVFGSNSEGKHDGGAAKLAHEKFGASYGNGAGIQGKSYAINSMDGIEILEKEIYIFIQFAKENSGNIFLVTEIGCGIAGYKSEQIAPFFQYAKQFDNIHLPESFWEVPLRTYKAFDKDMKCRDFQYEFEKEFTHDGKVLACNSGFHSCENPIDMFSYYIPSESRFAYADQYGEIDRHDDDSKIASSKIKIGAEINIKSIIDMSIKFMFSRVKWGKENNISDREKGAIATGDSSASSATGDRSASSATGDRSASSATGYGSASSATGDSSASSATGDSSASSATGYGSASSATGYGSASSATGDRSASSATGYRSASSATGDRSASSATGDSSASSATGDRSASIVNGAYSTSEILGEKSINAVAIGTGPCNKARGVIGSWLVLAEWNDNNKEILSIQTTKVDGKKIKEGIWYEVKKGKFSEVK